jgi:urease accessory protein
MSLVEPLNLVNNVKGRLTLAFENQSGQTILKVQRQEPPLKVVRAFPLPGGAALVHLHNLSGGVLGGDRLETRVELAPGTAAQVTSTSATRLYRSNQAGLVSGQLNEFMVGENARLEYLPDPLIPFAGARYRQHTRIELAPGAGLFWWETVAPGREARGEIFEYDLVELSLSLTGEGHPIALEQARLEPALRPLTSTARLGRYRYFTTFYMCRVGLEKAVWSQLETGLNELAGRLTVPGETLWGASSLATGGVVVRAVSRNGRALTTGLLAMWKLGKQELYGQAAIPPRKIY